MWLGNYLSSLITIFKEGLTPPHPPFFFLPTFFFHLAGINSSPCSSHFALEQHWLFSYFQSFKERNNIIDNYIFWLAVYLIIITFFIIKKKSFLSRVTPFFHPFLFSFSWDKFILGLLSFSGISSSPDSSHFASHHADDYLWSEQPKNCFCYFLWATSMRRGIFVY